ncbi:MAG: hypothetical protein AB8C84_05075 [Oligoflexales bacterium]
MFLRFFSVCFLLWVIGCDDPHKEEIGSVTAELKSTKLSSQSLALADGVVLKNITGLADSLGFNFTEDLACGFNVWGADSQTTKSGLEGRSYEKFNLGDPVSWESIGGGLQGDCDSAVVAQVESYFVYMDLHLTVDGVEKTVRAYMGQQAPFEAGDIVLKNGEILSWYDKDAEALVPSSVARPANPARFVLTKEVPWYDNNGTEKIVMMEFRMNTDVSTYTVTKQTGHVVIDVDFTNSGLSIPDTSDDASLLKTIQLPFLETDNYNSLLIASLTLFEDRPDDTLVKE